jgi:MoaA/NifB/PqqE/SkfB family radical SAM enzyme
MSDPFYIQWHITHHSNVRCKHCYQGDFSKKEDLDWTGLLEISEDLLSTTREWGRTTCILQTGGEPLLKPEIFLFLHEVNQKPEVHELLVFS